jgi:hypothetical protein
MASIYRARRNAGNWDRQASAHLLNISAPLPHRDRSGPRDRLPWPHVDHDTGSLSAKYTIVFKWDSIVGAMIAEGQARFDRNYKED